MGDKSAMTLDEQIASAQRALDAALLSLEQEAPSGVRNITVNGENQSFESRADTLAFINMMEKRIYYLKSRNAPLLHFQQVT